jgi:hypothetical protein
MIFVPRYQSGSERWRFGAREQPYLTPVPQEER